MESETIICNDKDRYFTILKAMKYLCNVKPNKYRISRNGSWVKLESLYDYFDGVHYSTIGMVRYDVEYEGELIV